MSYYEVRTLSGGTFTPGTDWYAQFDAVAPTGTPTMLGEVCSCEITDATALSLGVKVINPWTARLYIEASILNPVQLQYGSTIVEYTAAGSHDIELLPGIYAIRLIRQTGGIQMRAKILGPATEIVSLYAPGFDPLMTGLTIQSASNFTPGPPM